MATALGKIQSQLFAYVQMRRLQTVCTGELVRVLDITPQQERQLLSRSGSLQPDRMGSSGPVPRTVTVATGREVEPE